MKACLESDETVSLAAKDALRVCDLYGIPRAPPLIFVRRTLGEGSIRMEEEAPKIVEDIQTATQDATKAREVLQKTEETKIRSKRQREIERKESNKRNRESNETKKNEQKKPAVQNMSIDVETSTKEEVTKIANKTATTKSEKVPQRSQSSTAIEKCDGDKNKDQDILEEKHIPPLDKGTEVESKKGSHNVMDDGDDDDEFPEIDIVADGPDSDDD